MLFSYFNNADYSIDDDFLHNDDIEYNKLDINEVEHNVVRFWCVLFILSNSIDYFATQMIRLKMTFYVVMIKHVINYTSSKWVRIFEDVDMCYLSIQMMYIILWERWWNW